MPPRRAESRVLPGHGPWRVVPDTNVLVSAVLQPLGSSAAVVRSWQRGEIELVVCPKLLAELTEVLTRPKLQSRISAEHADAFVALLRSQAELRADPPVDPGLTPDPKDDYIISLARATRAGCIVSGDQDLAGVLAPPLMTPSALMDELQRRGQDE